MTKVPAAVRGGKAYSGKPVPRVGKLHDISVKDKQGLDLIEPAADIEGGKFVCRNWFHGSSRVICFFRHLK